MKAYVVSVATIASFAVTSFAQTTPADILTDYRQRFTSALKRTNETLEIQGAAVAATLVSRGDPAGAEEVSKQIKSKVAGEPVLETHPAAVTLFQQYDTARATALTPIKTASIGKIESMLKSTPGKKMDTILELAKVRQEIEGGKAPETSAPVPEFWTWHLKPDNGSSGTIRFFKNGTIEQQINGRKNNQFGKWKATKTPNLLSVTLDNETFSMTITGSDAVLDMSFGKRYLKVKTATPP